MKITGGIASGIPIQVLKGDRTRPTTDRIRESVFSRLQAFVPGKRVLDLFAGSGALGLDAVSRGAASVLFVEQHAATANLISQNARRLAPAGVTSDFRVLTLDVYRFLRNPAGVKVDLIFADPPYAYLQKEGGFESLLSAIHAADLLTEDGVLVVESGARIPLPTVPGWTLTKDKTFGTSRISFWLPGTAGILPASPGARASLPATDDAGILPASSKESCGQDVRVPGDACRDTCAPGSEHVGFRFVFLILARISRVYLVSVV